MSDAAVISPKGLRERLRAPGELALLDVRKLEAYRAGHLLWAAHVAPDQLDLVPALVPRRATPIVLTEATSSAVRGLRDRGYTAVVRLAGGNAGWTADGGRLYAKLCVPSKALAEQARAAYGTPELGVDELSADHVVVDVRTEAEYAAGTIPGALSCPGGELVHRALDALGARTAPVVVTCAGRTRAIFGAQTLRDAGVLDVAFLRGGTSAWVASGRTLEVGAARRLEGHGATVAREASARLAERFAIRVLDRATLAGWLADTARTTYLIDPRSPAPPTAHPLARAIPGGQLVEAVDEFIAVRGARVVLLDEAPFTRAIPLARWLEQLGVFAVAVASGADARTLAGDPAAPPASAAAAADPTAWSEALPAQLADEPGVALKHFPAAVAA